LAVVICHCYLPLLSAIVLTASTTIAATISATAPHPEAPHPEVTAALAWSLPENPCQQPELADRIDTQGLVTDFSRLKDSAQYGLTQQQGDEILAKLALIQASVEELTYVTNMQSLLTQRP